MTNLSDALSSSSIQFDIEGTGLGKVKGKMFAENVHIWQIGYSIKNSDPKAIFSSIPTKASFEQGAIDLYGKDIVDNKPGPYVRAINKKTEKEVLEEFIGVLNANPNSILEGWNIKNYDIPLLEHALKRHGMNEGIATLKSSKIIDYMDSARNILLSKLSPEATVAIFGDNTATDTYALKGTNLRNFAEGFGIDTGNINLHDAKEDVNLFNAVKERMVRNPDSFDAIKWARSVDRHSPKKGASFESRLKSLSNVQQTIDPSKIEIKPEVQASKPEAPEPSAATRSPIPPPSGPPPRSAPGPETPPRVDTKPHWFTKIGDDAFEVLKKPKAQKYGLIGVGIIAAAYMFKDMDVGSSANRADYISATSLGKPEEEILKSIKNSKNVKQYNKSVSEEPGFEEANRLRSGDEIHKLIEAELLRSDIGHSSEVHLKDDKLGIKGISDSVVEIDGKKYPVEVKSTSTENIMNMTEAVPTHASQTNFYSHALGAPGGWVLYASAEDPSIRKSFYIPYSPGRLIQDVSKFREIIIKNQQEPGVLHGWMKQMRQYFDSSHIVPSGVRDQHSKGSSFNGFEAMNENSERGFPGGRIQHFYKGFQSDHCVASKSKIRDQATRNAHLFPIGSPDYGNTSVNRSRQDMRN